MASEEDIPVKNFNEVFDLNKRLGKILIAGEEGSGKTLLSVCIAVGRMLRGPIDCWKSYERVEEFNKLGYKFSTDYEHLVFSNFEINCEGTKIPTFKNYDVDPFRIGLYCDEYQFDLFPPGTEFHLTEAHLIFNAYMWQYVRPEVTGYWTTTRQYDINLVADTNQPNKIVNTVRELFNRIFHLYDEVEHIFEKGVCVGHKFKVLEFRNNMTYTQYLKTGKEDNCKKYHLLVNVCRWNNYFHDRCKILHLKGREFEDFCIRQFKPVESIEDVEALSDSFGVIAPEGYYRKLSDFSKKKDKKFEEELEEEEVF